MIKKIIEKTKDEVLKAKAKCISVATYAPDVWKSIVASALATVTTFDMAFANFSATGAVEKMTEYIADICMGAGIILGLVSVFNWISGFKEDNAERQNKATTNILIAGVLICIKPVASAILTALGASSGLKGLGTADADAGATK